MLDYKEFMSPENQVELRARLWKVIVRQKIGLTQAATDVGISYNTMRKFVVDHEDIKQMDTLAKIDFYIMQYED